MYRRSSMGTPFWYCCFREDRNRAHGPVDENQGARIGESAGAAPCGSLHSVAETSVAAVGTPRAVVERGRRETCRAQMRAAEGPVRQSGPCPGRSGPSVAPSPRACASRALRGLVWASLSREAPLTRLAAPIEREKQEGGSSTANQCAGSVPSGCRFGRAASASFPRLAVAGLCEPVRASLCNVTPRDCQASCSWL